MGPFLAWLPFLAALILAFVAGVVFSRINEGLMSVPSEKRGVLRRGVLSKLDRADVVLTIALIGLLVAVLLVWIVAVLHLLRGHG